MRYSANLVVVIEFLQQDSIRLIKITVKVLTNFPQTLGSTATLQAQTTCPGQSAPIERLDGFRTTPKQSPNHPTHHLVNPIRSLTKHKPQPRYKRHYIRHDELRPRNKYSFSSCARRSAFRRTLLVQHHRLSYDYLFRPNDISYEPYQTNQAYRSKVPYLTILNPPANLLYIPALQQISTPLAQNQNSTERHALHLHFAYPMLLTQDENRPTLLSYQPASERLH